MQSIEMTDWHITTGARPGFSDEDCKAEIKPMPQKSKSNKGKYASNMQPAKKKRKK